MSSLAGSYTGRRRMAAAVSYSESAVVFQCDGLRLIGVITRPLGHPRTTGVLILVGGPQYRAGSHRQFTLLARDLAGHGITSLRFDARGMGDSEGDPQCFDALDDDIEAAMNSLCTHEPRLRSIVIWGLCDAASAALIYGHRDSRVSGLVLLNPWVHTEASAARTRLKHYYLRRLVDLSFWRKLFSGHFRVGESLEDLGQSLRATFGPRQCAVKRFDHDYLAIGPDSASNIDQPQPVTANFIERMHEGLYRFTGEILCILSENDLIASEFDALINKDRSWRNTYRSKRITQRFIPLANHTFSSHEWREAVSKFTVEFVEHK